MRTFCTCVASLCLTNSRSMPCDRTTLAASSGLTVDSPGGNRFGIEAPLQHLRQPKIGSPRRTWMLSFRIQVPARSHRSPRKWSSTSLFIYLHVSSHDGSCASSGCRICCISSPRLDVALKTTQASNLQSGHGPSFLQMSFQFQLHSVSPGRPQSL